MSAIIKHAAMSAIIKHAAMSAITQCGAMSAIRKRLRFNASLAQQIAVAKLAIPRERRHVG